MQKIVLLKTASDFSALKKKLAHKAQIEKRRRLRLSLSKHVRIARKRYKGPNQPFVMLRKEMLRSPEWQSGLSSSEKVLYIHLKSKYVGHNNGEIDLHYSELEAMMAPATISKAFKGLEAKGWIEKTKLGGLYRYSNLYKLTGNYDTALVNNGY